MLPHPCYYKPLHFYYNIVHMHLWTTCLPQQCNPARRLERLRALVNDDQIKETGRQSVHVVRRGASQRARNHLRIVQHLFFLDFNVRQNKKVTKRVYKAEGLKNQIP